MLGHAAPFDIIPAGIRTTNLSNKMSFRMIVYPDDAFEMSALYERFEPQLCDALMAAGLLPCNPASHNNSYFQYDDRATAAWPVHHVDVSINRSGNAGPIESICFTCCAEETAGKYVPLLAACHIVPQSQQTRYEMEAASWWRQPSEVEIYYRANDYADVVDATNRVFAEIGLSEICLSTSHILK